MRMFRIYCLSSFQIHHIVVLTVAIMYTFLVLTFLMTGTLYLLITFIQFSLLLPSSPVWSFFYEFDF